MKIYHYDLFYHMGSLVLQNLMKTYVDNSTFCSENFDQNSKSEDNFLIRSGNKI